MKMDTSQNWKLEEKSVLVRPSYSHHSIHTLVNWEVSLNAERLRALVNWEKMSCSVIWTKCHIENKSSLYYIKYTERKNNFPLFVKRKKNP